MSKLIEELKSEHKDILDILDQAKIQGIASRAGQEKLISARDLLTAHIRKEDEKYYPELRRAAGNNEDLKIIMDYFVRDMEDVSKKAMQLFDKYAHGGDEEAFAGEIKLLYMMLKDRIRTEEETLFKKFSAV